MSYDYTLSLDTDELIEDIGEPEIKRALINAMPWLTAFCLDPRSTKINNLYDITLDIIEYFDKLLQKEGEDIHNFAEATLIRCDTLTTIVKFRGIVDD